MRRDVLFDAISKIIFDLEDCDILYVLRQVIETTHGLGNNREHQSIFPIEAFRQYSIATNSYSDTEREITKLLEIEGLLDTTFWKSIAEFTTGGEKNPADSIYEMMNNVRFTLEQLPKVLALIQQDYILDVKEQDKELPEILKGKALLTVLLIEEQSQFSSPKRLVHLLDAITDLYSVFAKLESESESEIIVLACDSGSDKSFDFLGITKIIEQVRELILQIWDRCVFHRQNQASRNLSLIAESLPILKKIDDLKSDKSIGPEEAELLRRKVVNGATLFIESGAIIEEMENASIHRPRQLMKPEPKLLASPWGEKESSKEDHKSNQSSIVEEGLRKNQESVEEENTISDEEGEISDEELERLELRVKKAKQKKSNSKKSSPKKKKT